MEPDTHFAFTAELTAVQLRAGVRRAGRRATLVLRILGLILVADGLPLAVLSESDRWIGMIIVALGVGVVLGAPFLARSVRLRRARRTLDGPISYRIDAEGVHTASRYTDGVVRWPLIDRCEQLPDLLLLWIGKGVVILVPVSELAATTRAALVAFVRSHLGGAAPAAPAGEPPAVRAPTP
ncbi:YcxB family protein [Actinoplanes sp. NPDC026623]|uniref:YcxB family protein n=1 Tax=Actinoplanes sp. NPDC026623 TaxID=3155610 RepID=UPI0033FBD3FE